MLGRNGAPADVPTVWSSDVLTGSAAQDWSLIVRTSANALIEGPDASTSMMFQALMPSLRSPVHAWHHGRLPSGRATVLIPDAAAVSPDDQEMLFDWIYEGTGRRVIAAAATSLFTRVQRNRFDLDLYYRLNFVLLRL